MPSIMDGVNQLTQLVGRNRLELLMFHLGSRQRFGINVFKVREVIKCPPLTRVPQSHPVVRGVANLRGMTVPVLDLAAAVGLRPQEGGQDLYVVVTEYNRRVLGFLVSAVDRIVNMNWEAIKPPPQGMGSRSYLTAVTEVDKGLVEIIDVEQVMADVIGARTEVSGDVRDAKDLEACHAQHVLVVDDSALARKQIIRVLEQLGISYTPAANGLEGLEILETMARESAGPVSARLSMVISDVEMPVMDGYTLTRRIKESPALQDLYVCLHTSLSGVFNEAMIKKVGADAFLAKYQPDELAALVLDYMKLRRDSGTAAA